MKTQIETFLKSRQFRSEFAYVIGMTFEESEKSKLSFNEIKRMAVEKEFGKSDIVEGCLVDDEIRILEYCIDRDTKSYLSQSKSQRRTSGLPELIEENKRELARLRNGK